MLTIEYIAGFFDGEGCVNICSSRRSGYVRTNLRASIGNTEPEVLFQIQRQWGGQIRTLKGHNRPVFLLVMTTCKCVDFLKAVRPHSLVKASQIDVALEYWEFMHGSERFHVDGKRVGSWRRTQESISQEFDFKNRLHVLKGTSSTKGRDVWNGPSKQVI